jgi:hypothetical protein
VLELTFVAVLIGLLAIVVRGSTAGPLDTLERSYLVAAPLPVLLALVLPAPISQLMQANGSSQEWAAWLNAVGGWLSLALILAGTLLLVRRSGRQQKWDRRLLIGLLAAALPAIMITLVALMYAI